MTDLTQPLAPVDLSTPQTPRRVSWFRTGAFRTVATLVMAVTMIVPESELHAKLFRIGMMLGNVRRLTLGA